MARGTAPGAMTFSAQNPTAPEAGASSCVSHYRKPVSRPVACCRWRDQNGIGISASAGNGAQASTRSATIAPTTTMEGELNPSAAT